MNIKEAKQRIDALVQTFHSERREKINGAETRLRFIDPFFEALGWDIRNPKEVMLRNSRRKKNIDSFFIVYSLEMSFMVNRVRCSNQL